MGERRLYAFPVAIAAYPALFLASQFPLNAGLDELAIVVLAFGAAAAAVYAATFAVLRRRAGAGVIALVTTAIVGFLFCGQMVADRVPFMRQRATLALLAALAAIVSAWLVLRRRPARTVVRTVGLFAYFLLLSAATHFWLAKGRADRTAERASAAVGFDRPIPLASGEGRRRPDIWLLIVDGMANEPTIEAFKGGSNRRFVDSLRALGFALPAVWSNYPWTAQSLSSLLNVADVNGIRRNIPRGVSQDGVYFRLVQSGRVPRTLAAAGYSIYLESSVGFGGSHRLDAPFRRLGPRGADRVRAAFGVHTLGAAAVQATLPGRVLAMRGRSLAWPEVQLRQFDDVRRAIGEPGPKFVLLHTLLTHDPFMLDRSCRARRVPAPPDSAGSAYVEHVHCASGKLTQLVTEILRRSPEPPVILIQGDHGSWPAGLTTSQPAASLREAELTERYGAFGAYYLPDGGARAIPPVMSPVNVLRLVLGQYLGANLPLLPNASYYAPRDALTPFTDVDTLPFARFHERWANAERPDVAKHGADAPDARDVSRAAPPAQRGASQVRMGETGTARP
ncbi:MAG TPA: hypothetical protein VKA84_23170 [Gemmatimonadaceae bacterium]|nr:hypothetical protein [Gemmatimonadaceae bacterium]